MAFLNDDELKKLRRKAKEEFGIDGDDSVSSVMTSIIVSQVTMTILILMCALLLADGFDRSLVLFVGEISILLIGIVTIVLIVCVSVLWNKVFNDNDEHDEKEL